MKPTPEQTLRTLRDCQSRSAREQQIISGRDWLLVTVFVQLLSSIYPLYVWITDTFRVYGTTSVDTHVHYAAIGMLGMSAVLFFLWAWGKYAPFRAACVALAFYISLQIVLIWLLPHRGTEGLAPKICVLIGLLMAVRVGYRRRHSG